MCAMNPRLMRPLARRQASGTPASLLLRFDGNFNDSSANSLTVTPEGDAEISTTTKKYGSGSAYFDGDGDFLTASGAGFGLSGDFTIEAWVFLDSEGGGTRPIVSCYDEGTSADPFAKWLLYANGSGRIDFLAEDAEQSSWSLACEGGQAPSDEWFHVAVARAGANITIFVNGLDVTSSVTNGDLVVPFGDTLGVGTLLENGSVRSDFSGYIDDLRIVKGLAVYTGPFIPPTGPLAVNATPAPVQAAASLLLNFDGNFNDSSPNALTVTANGDASINTTTKKYGSGSGEFNGTDEALSVAGAGNFGTGDFTIEAWIYPRSLSSAEQTLAAKWESGGYAWLWNFKDDEIYLVSGIGSFYVAITGAWSPAANEWHHVAMTRSGGTMRLFADGVQIASEANSDNFVTAYPMTICNLADGGGLQWFDGYVDDLRVVEGLAVYTGPFIPPTGPLAVNATPAPVIDPYFSSVSLLLHFDGSIADASSNNLSITVEGDAAISAAQSKFGSGSCLFDADGDGLLLADSPLLTAGSGDFTAEAWVRPATNSGVLGIFAKRNYGAESGLEFVCYALNGYSYLVVSESGTGWSYNDAGSEAIPANEWTHVAFVKNGTSAAVYVNGVLSQSGTLGGAMYDGNESFFIGSGGFEGQLFDGYIDEVRITKGVARYTAAFTPPDAPFPNQ